MENVILKIKNLNAYYGSQKVLKNVNLEIYENRVTTILGPSGCGKTTLIRCINRLHELSPGARIEGQILLKGEDLYQIEPMIVRQKIGMVFQKPNPFPTMTIYDNVIAGYILSGIKLSKEEKDKIVEESLIKSGLWDEVKENLFKKGTFLSGGQQQRLCIARALAMKPEILLLDEPTSALDPVATSIIEELIIELKKSVTTVLVTHNIGQAGRVSDYTAFFYLGELIEFGKTTEMFTVPKSKKTEEYLIGKIG
ncbi:MAG: phosphate ABC transporter ATP-binding protein [Caldisericia bacterium]|jgi:phosphate transport system ATP-binding protein|nr:phosphate ABC transporter ATP-binding protein [Caldisericia bacterium]